MAKPKAVRKTVTLTRREFVDRMNVLRRDVDNVILNLIYNPTSNKEVLTKVAKIKKDVQKLPRICVEKNIFPEEKDKDNE